MHALKPFLSYPDIFKAFLYHNMPCICIFY